MRKKMITSESLLHLQKLVRIREIVNLIYFFKLLYLVFSDILSATSIQLHFKSFMGSWIKR